MCRHFCAPVYSVFLLFVISVLFQNAVTKKTETVRLEHSEQSSPFCLLFLRRRKKLNISWYQLWPQWLYFYYYYCMTHSFTEKAICGMYLHSFLYCFVRSFVRLVVCMFSFFSVSLCQSTNTDTCSCATEIL